MTFFDFIREFQFLTKQRNLQFLFVVVFVLSIFSVWTGVAEIHSQQSTIDRLLEKDMTDRASVQGHQSSYGSAAYYSFHLTYSEPNPLAFAAMGHRDIYPWKHRVRMLALEGQIYEADAANPELSFLGRFDFAFLVSTLIPLFVILLLHDIRSHEREAGRLDLLVVTAKNQNKIWLARASVLMVLLSLALLIPFVLAALYLQTDIKATALMVMVTITHVIFWAVITLRLGAISTQRLHSSARIVSVLLGIWLLATVVLPVISDALIKKTITGPNGGEVVLVQREAVNSAWDLPFSATWDPFVKSHPEWKDKTHMDALFEWKWYYAFQQMGDEMTAELSQRFRESIIRRDQAAGIVAYFSPPMLSQRLMTKLAYTDISAALAYEQNVRDFHQSLRDFYYPLMFNKVEFSLETLKQVPQFKSNN
jgi:ABC-2 type transport system permease protein